MFVGGGPVIAKPRSWDRILFPICMFLLGSYWNAPEPICPPPHRQSQNETLISKILVSSFFPEREALDPTPKYQPYHNHRKTGNGVASYVFIGRGLQVLAKIRKASRVRRFRGRGIGIGDQEKRYPRAGCLCDQRNHVPYSLGF